MSQPRGLGAFRAAAPPPLPPARAFCARSTCSSGRGSSARQPTPRMPQLARGGRAATPLPPCRFQLPDHSVQGAAASAAGASARFERDSRQLTLPDQAMHECAL
eukprot:366432-Chlamydomonas_euryale.AAC.8